MDLVWMDLFANYLVFKKKNIFCIKEHLKVLCQIFKNHNHFILIDEQGLSLNNVEDNVNSSLVYDGLMPCEKCNFGQGYPTSRIYYYIAQYPKNLFFRFTYVIIDR